MNLGSLPLLLPSPLLTRREYTVLHLLAQGLTNKEMATQLCLSDQTVGTYLKSLYRKLDVHNRVMAVRTAQEQDLLTSVAPLVRG